MLYQNVIDDFVAAAKEIIGEKLTGIYLHGSLAMGCFNPEKSDIDLIIVIEQNISDKDKMKFMERVVALNQQAPAKGLEMSIVLRKYCSLFVYPTPFELHFSPTHLQWFYDAPHNYVQNMKGDDKDLAAHFTIIRQYGVTLYGEEIENVFAKVPRQNYIDSIWEDICDAKKEILKQPMYITLNLCRVLAFLKDGLYLSKQEGARWAMEHLNAEYTPIISDALMCYQTDREMVIGEESGGKFADEMLAEIMRIQEKNTMEDFGFMEMQKLQRELQEKYKDKWEAICPETAKNKLLWLMIELGEAADIIKKDGSTAIMEKDDVRKHFIEEMSDILMYYNDILLCYDISIDELRQIYLNKHQKNLSRW